MKTHRLALAYLLVALTGAPLYAGIHARLSSEATKVLPAVPLPLVLTVTADEPNTLPEGVWFIAERSGSSEVFVVNPFLKQREQDWAVVPKDWREVKPSSPRILRWDDGISPVVSPFTDPRLVPGTYSIRAVIGGTVPQPDHLDGQVTTNAVTIEIGTFSDDDAAVWSWMLAQTSGTGWGFYEWFKFEQKVAEYVYTKFPNSNYLPYVAPAVKGMEKFKHDPEAATAVLEETLKRFPVSPKIEDLKILLMHDYSSLARSVAKADQERAFKYADRAHSLALELEQSQNPNIQYRFRSFAAGIPTRDDVAQIAGRHPER